jgi:ECF transporter S component (folate family)
MQKTTQHEQGVAPIKRLLLSETLAEKNTSHKIAYIAVITALVVVANMFFEFKFADTQFSLTIVFSAMAGIILGPFFGFAACFLGDLVGFLYNSAGFMYMPWIGISMGMVALISGFVLNGIKINKKWGIYLKIFLVCVLTFVISTVAINTTAFWLLYTKGVPYFAYLKTRLFIQGQIWNSLVNYTLLFAIIPTLGKIKALKLNIN